MVTTATVPVYAELILELSHRARDVHPGEVVVLEVRTSENPATLSATAFGKSLRFFRTSNEVWAALLGIDLTIEPGSYDVLVRGTAQDGVVTRECTESVQIILAEFLLCPWGFLGGCAHCF